MSALCRPLAVALLAAVVLLAAPGCALFGKKKPVPEATLPAWVGRVVMVDTTHGFALVDTGLPVPPPAVGASVITFRDEHRTSVLRVTGDSRPPYLALEIVEGVPALDDKAVLDEERAVPTPL